MNAYSPETVPSRELTRGRARGRHITAVAAVLLVAAVLALTWTWRSNGAASSPTRSAPSAQTAPEAQINSFKPLAPAQAETINAGIPVSADPIEAALPFALPGGSRTALARDDALDCLTTAIYYEAASEPPQGQRAVAQGILNRVRHPAFPHSVCGVVYQGSERTTGCQFTFTCDGSLARRPSRAGWDRARSVAAASLAGLVEPSVGTATHYHASWVVPYWASSLLKLNTVGAHIFYRWPSHWGRRRAFSARYDGEEPLDLPTADALGSTETIAVPIQAAASSVISVSPSRLRADEVVSGLGAGIHSAGGTDGRSVAADAAAGALLADERSGSLRGTDTRERGLAKPSR